MGVFIKVDNQRVISIAGTVANQQMIDEGYFEYDGEIPSSPYLKYIDGQVIEDTERGNVDKEAFNAEIKAQIAELDLKRIRALAEGGTNPDTGKLYLEEYTEQIAALRVQIL